MRSIVAQGVQFIVKPGWAIHAAIFDARGWLDVDCHLDVTDHVPVSTWDDSRSDPRKPTTEGHGEGVFGKEDGSCFVVYLAADSEEVNLPRTAVDFFGVEWLVG